MNYNEEYDCWLKLAISDKDLIEELKSYDDKAVEDAFYRDLAFGTGGLQWPHGEKECIRCQGGIVAHFGEKVKEEVI